MKKVLFVLCLLFVITGVLMACDSHEHTFAEDWTSDATNHWHAASCEHTDEKSDVAAHSWNAGTVTTEATEAAAGVKTFTCTVCAATKTESIPALGHTHAYTDVVTAPTCTAAGYTTHTCACGDVVTDTPVAATGHAYAAAVTAPTCEAAGYTTHTCTACQDSYTDTPVAATGHAYAPVVTDPTCEAAGYTTYTCPNCEDSYTEAGEAALGHADADKDSLCDECETYIELPLTGATELAADHTAAITYGATTYYYVDFTVAVNEARANALPEVVLLKDVAADATDDIYISAGQKLTIKGADGANVVLSVAATAGIEVVGELTLENLTLSIEKKDPAIKCFNGSVLAFVDAVVSPKQSYPISSATDANITVKFIDSAIVFDGTTASGTYLVYFAGTGALTIVADGFTTDISVAKATSSNATINLDLTDVTKTGSTITSFYLGSPKKGTAAFGDDDLAKEFGYTHRLGVEGVNAEYFLSEADALMAARGDKLLWDISGSEPVEVEIPCIHVEVPVDAVDPTCTEDGLTAGTKCELCNEPMQAQQTVPATGHTDADEDGVCDVCEDAIVLDLAGATEQTADHVAAIVYGTTSYYYTSVDAAVAEALANKLTKIVILKDASTGGENANKYIALGESLVITGANSDVVLTVAKKGFQVYKGSLTFKNIKLDMVGDSIVYYNNGPVSFKFENVVMAATNYCIDNGHANQNVSFTFINSKIEHKAPDASGSAYVIYITGNTVEMNINGLETNARLIKSSQTTTVNVTATDVTVTDATDRAFPAGMTGLTVNFTNDATAMEFGYNYRVGDVAGGAMGAVYFNDATAANEAANGATVYDLTAAA